MKILYSKFNRNRLPEFQLKTSIINDEGNIYVEKQALNNAAYTHIENIYNNYRLLHERYPNMKFVHTTRVNDYSLRFDYVKGSTLDALLLKSVLTQDMNQFIQYIKEYIVFLREFKTIKISRFEPDNEFLKIFDCRPHFGDVECMFETNVDLTFDNIIINNTDNIVIDYEWIFNTKVPIDYIVFRSLSRFYWKYGEYLRGFVSIEEILRKLKITNTKDYQEMEQGFQSYVLGSRQYELSSNYRREIINISELKQQANDYRNKLVKSRILLSEKSHENEEISKERSILENKMIECNTKLTHAQFQTDKYKNEAALLKELNKGLQISVNQYEKELDVLYKSAAITNEEIENKIKELNRIEQTWRGKIGKKIIGGYIKLSKDIVTSNNGKIAVVNNELLRVKDEQLQKMQVRLKELELRLEEFEQYKLPKELQINHLQTQLEDLLSKHHNLDISHKHLAQVNHDNNIKSEEIKDAYQSIQEKYHQLKFEHDNLLKQIYNGLREEDTN
jgi:hypothetical protein